MDEVSKGGSISYWVNQVCFISIEDPHTMHDQSLGYSAMTSMKTCSNFSKCWPARIALLPTEFLSQDLKPNLDS